MTLVVRSRARFIIAASLSFFNRNTREGVRKCCVEWISCARETCEKLATMTARLAHTNSNLGDAKTHIPGCAGKICRVIAASDTCRYDYNNNNKRLYSVCVCVCDVRADKMVTILQRQYQIIIFVIWRERALLLGSKIVHSRAIQLFTFAMPR